MSEGASNALSVALQSTFGAALANRLTEAKNKLSDSDLTGQRSAVPGYERADVRTAATVPDDGGEGLSTAPSSIELNGQASRDHWRITNSAAFADLALRNRFSEPGLSLSGHIGEQFRASAAEGLPNPTLESQQSRGAAQSAVFGEVHGEQANPSVLWMRAPLIRV